MYDNYGDNIPVDYKIEYRFCMVDGGVDSCRLKAGRT